VRYAAAVLEAPTNTSRSLRAPRWALVGVTCGLVLAGCHRNIEPFVPGEEPRSPNVARIFPEAERSASTPAAQATARSAPRPPGAQPRMPAAPQRGNVPASAGISGTIAVSPELTDRVAPTGTLFVIARKSGATGGPPLAVLRIPGPRFPVTFEIGQEQVMIPGLQFQGEIQLTARLDSDGNAMTKLPGDLAGAASNPTAPGTDGVEIVLDSTI